VHSLSALLDRALDAPNVHGMLANCNVMIREWMLAHVGAPTQLDLQHSAGYLWQLSGGSVSLNVTRGLHMRIRPPLRTTTSTRHLQSALAPAGLHPRVASVPAPPAAHRQPLLGQGALPPGSASLVQPHRGGMPALGALAAGEEYQAPEMFLGSTSGHEALSWRRLMHSNAVVGGMLLNQLRVADRSFGLDAACRLRFAALQSNCTSALASSAVPPPVATGSRTSRRWMSSWELRWGQLRRSVRRMVQGGLRASHTELFIPYGVDPAFKPASPLFSDAALRDRGNLYDVSAGSRELSPSGAPFAFFPRFTRADLGFFPVVLPVCFFSPARALSHAVHPSHTTWACHSC
jgi:hypothetical protein